MLNWVAEDTLQRRHLPYSVAITMQTRKVKGSASHSTPPSRGASSSGKGDASVRSNQPRVRGRLMAIKAEAAGWCFQKPK